MKHYIPCVGLQLVPQGGVQYITFVNGKLYIRFEKYNMNNQWGPGLSRLKEQWPTQLIIGNCTHIKLKLYYKVSKKLEISTLAGDLNGQQSRTYLAANVGGETHNVLLAGQQVLSV